MGIWLPSSSPDSDYRNGWSFPMIKQTYWVPTMCSRLPGTSQEAWPCPTLKVHLSSLNQQVGQGRMSLEGPALVRWSRQRPPALHPHPLNAPQVTHAERRVFENSSSPGASIREVAPKSVGVQILRSICTLCPFPRPSRGSGPMGK